MLLKESVYGFYLSTATNFKCKLNACFLLFGGVSWLVGFWLVGLLLFFFVWYIVNPFGNTQMCVSYLNKLFRFYFARGSEIGCYVKVIRLFSYCFSSITHLQT